MEKHQEVLNNITIQGNVAILPDGQLERSVYTKVAKALEVAGGKWNAKAGGFVFKNDPTENIRKIQSGEKVNIKKEYQMFFTPEALANRMAAMIDPQKSDFILEPSAGDGSLVRAVQRIAGDVDIRCVELNADNVELLRNIYAPNGERVFWNMSIYHEDFMERDTTIMHRFTKIIANPPFTKNQDIVHIKRMYELLELGGTLVTLSSTHWCESQNKVETEFREWLEEVNAELEKLPKGTFAESGTNIETVLIKIVKHK